MLLKKRERDGGTVIAEITVDRQQHWVAVQSCVINQTATELGNISGRADVETARISTDSENIAAVCDVFTAPPKRPYGKAPVRSGSLRPANTTFRDRIFGNCRYKLVGPVAQSV